MSWVESLKRYNHTHPSHEPDVDLSEAGLAARATLKEQQVLHELRRLYYEHRKQKKQRKEERRKKEREARGRDAAGGKTEEQEKAAAALSASIPRFYIKRTTSPPPASDSPTPEDEEVAQAAAAEAAANIDPNDPSSSLPPPPQPSLSMATQLRRAARERYLITRADQLFDDRELSFLWETIQTHSVDVYTSTGLPVPAATHIPGGHQQILQSTGPPTQFDTEKRLSYDSFLLISHTLPLHKSFRYFKPSIFLLFPQDSSGRISSRTLWRYITKRIQLTRFRISITCYDDLGYGYLREQDLENYVYDQLVNLPALSTLERDFYPYYVFTAVRKFIFFLDPHRRGKLRIRNIIESSVMAEFDALRFPHGHHSSTKKSSWFSAQHTQDVYSEYLGLDSNQNGMLSREEFKAYNGGNLTNIFIDGLFAEYRMYPSSNTVGEGEGGEEDGGVDRDEEKDEKEKDKENGDKKDEENVDNPPSGPSTNSTISVKNELEMDYKTFLDFVLAMTYKTTPAAISYFFKILDFQHQGYLDTFTLNYWFRAVSEKMQQLGHEQVDIADVVANEIFDMVCPAVPDRITLNDLISCRCGHTVISILIDVNGFWKYDNRETLIAQQADEEES